MHREEFVRRLEAGGYPYLNLPGLSPTGSRIHAVGAQEAWTVHFDASGEAEVEEVYAVVGLSPALPPEERRLSDFFGRMARAWAVAAQELDIRVVSPFGLGRGRGPDVHVACLLPDFGGPKGTVICSRDDPEDAADLADELGYYTAGLNPRWYESYDETRFTEALRDWGWYGPGPPPAWLLS